MPEETFYPDPDDQSSAMEGNNPPAKKSSKKDEEPETALLPRSIFGDKELEPGSECTFEIVRVFDDEVEVKYSHSAKDGKNKMAMEETGASMMEAERDMDRMTGSE